MFQPMDRRFSRRGALKCLAWAGTGVLWTVSGGIPRSFALDGAAVAAGAGFTFVQISDSHIGFHKPVNPDVTATLRETVARINALPVRPAFVVHTGDITDFSKPEEFDTAAEILKEIKGIPVHYVPGEHDLLDGDGQAYLARYGKGTLGNGWYSFDHGGVHVLALNNVAQFKPGGLGLLGDSQVAWLREDVAGLSSETPIVVLAHMPLWPAYAKWGWGTDDAVEALGYLRRFGSVTVLNGHIHQVMQKIEGNFSFHTARSTAFPQPEPGTAPGPGPLMVPAGALRDYLGLRSVTVQPGDGPLALTDRSLAS